MNRSEIIEITKKFLSEEFEVDAEKIVPENNLKDTLDLDSLDYVDLVVVIEENLNFKPTAEDFKTVLTFEDFYNLAEKKMNEEV
jgi:acyl carrier protein